MALFEKGNIRKKVLQAVEARITDGQKEFDAEAAKEDQRLAEGIGALTMACARAKFDAETRIVNSIIT